MQLVGAGRAFLVSGHPFTSAPHLWFVLCDPAPITRNVVAVMVVTARAYTDKTVVLEPGDHPFIQRQSNVDFGAAVLLKVDRFHDAITSEKCHLQPDMSQELLIRVRAGLRTSPRTIHAIRDYCAGAF